MHLSMLVEGSLESSLAVGVRAGVAVEETTCCVTGDCNKRVSSWDP